MVKIQKIVSNNSEIHASKVGEKHYSSGCDFHIGIKMALQGGNIGLDIKIRNNTGDIQVCYFGVFFVAWDLHHRFS